MDREEWRNWCEMGWPLTRRRRSIVPIYYIKKQLNKLLKIK